MLCYIGTRYVLRTNTDISKSCLVFYYNYILIFLWDNVVEIDILYDKVSHDTLFWILDDSDITTYNYLKKNVCIEYWWLPFRHFM